jgi:TonB family protein
MNHQALLFCADEKTVRAVTQVFRELDFSVEVNNEPFDAVKRLMAQHFDAIVVDCESEENATLLFKSARNSALNNGSLAVAVVEGQANIAKAFRLGGNLVLTKPINLEQAKGTLRVARGLLRKAEANKLAASISNPPGQAVITPEVKEEKTLAAAAGSAQILTPLPVPTSSTISPTSEAKKESQAKSAAAPAEAVSEAQKGPVAEKNPASGLSLSAATAATPAKETPRSKPEILEPKPVPKETKPVAEKTPEKADTSAKPAAAASKGASTSPRFATLGVKPQDAPMDAAQSHKNFWIAAVIVLGLAAAGYFGWTKYHDVIKLPFVQSTAETVAPPAAKVPQPPVQAMAAPAASTPATGADIAAAAATPAVTAVPTHDAMGIVRLSETTSQGLLLKRLDPSYPDQAKEQKLQGSVHLQARINRAGEVTQVTTVSGNAILAEAATAAVKQWKYKPYTVNGTPVEVLTPITVDLKP